MINKVLIVAAHSDDEVLGCAGTIAKHVESGDKVHLIFMTNGVGSRKASSSESIENRKKAAQKVIDILGVSSMQNFNFPDNKMDTVPLLDLVRVVEGVINKIQPSIIYTHHIGDLNIDHQITHNAVMTACRPEPDFCVKEMYAFEVLSSTEWQTPGYLPFIPNVYSDISGQIETKKKALKAYSNEMRKPPHSRSAKNSICQAKYRGSNVGLHYAEAFILLRKIR